MHIIHSLLQQKYYFPCKNSQKLGFAETSGIECLQRLLLLGNF